MLHPPRRYDYEPCVTAVADSKAASSHITVANSYDMPHIEKTLDSIDDLRFHEILPQPVKCVHHLQELFREHQRGGISLLRT